MSIEKLSEDILCVELPSDGHKIAEELNSLNEMVSEQCTYDVIIDFFRVEVLNSWNISTLQMLRSLLQDSGHQLVLFNIKVITKCIFTVAGLRKAFVFANNKESALKALQHSESSSNAH